ncbi:MAG TPA: HNH endonuclease signature motif containing protein [Cyclobacteriaceae bacterium]
MSKTCEWRKVPDYENYFVSEFGDVVDSKGRRIPTTKTKKGYIRVYMKNRVFGVHQIVAMAFMGHKPNGCTMVVDHIDNNKMNNHFSNLQILSHSINSSKGSGIGWRDTPIGITWDSDRCQWAVRPRVKGKLKRFGRFNTLEEATATLNSLNPHDVG